MFFIVNTDLMAVQPGDTIVVTFMGTLTVVTFELQVKKVQSNGFVDTDFGFFRYTCTQDNEYFCIAAVLNCGGVRLDV